MNSALPPNFFASPSHCTKKRSVALVANRIFPVIDKWSTRQNDSTYTMRTRPSNPSTSKTNAAMQSGMHVPCDADDT